MDSYLSSGLPQGASASITFATVDFASQVYISSFTYPDPVLALTDSDGNILVNTSDGILHVPPDSFHVEAAVYDPKTASVKYNVEPITVSDGPLNEQDVDTIHAQVLAQAGDQLKIPGADYILVGDEPPKGERVIDITTSMSVSDLQNLKSLLQLMPRMTLRQWFDDNVVKAMPGWNAMTQKKPCEDMVWAGFIDLFNKVNLDYITQNNLTPWDWEAQKQQAVQVSSDKAAMDQIDQELSSVSNNLVVDSDRAADLITQYGTLPKLQDVGLEINRQNAVNTLLAQKEYDLVQGIIEAYRSAQYDTTIGTDLTKPVPVDIVTLDGDKVYKTPPDNILTN